jgi:hypothetical protein
LLGRPGQKAKAFCLFYYLKEKTETFPWGTMAVNLIGFKTKTGNVFFLDGIGVLIINGEGKIQKDREYFDLAYFQSQLQQ